MESTVGQYKDLVDAQGRLSAMVCFKATDLQKTALGSSQGGESVAQGFEAWKMAQRSNVADLTNFEKEVKEKC